MAFDFFNEGIKKEAAIEFSKEENMYSNRYGGFWSQNSLSWIPRRQNRSRLARPSSFLNSQEFVQREYRKSSKTARYKVTL